VTWKEVHLSVGPGFRRPSLAASGLRLSASSSSVTTTTHYDTEDLRLASWQCTLRRGPRSRWVVSVESRDVETFRGDDEPPEAAVAFVAAYRRGRPLRPLVTLRTAQRVLTMEGDDLVTVRIDDERTETVGRPSGPPLRRLTVAAPRAARKQAATVVRLLRDAGAHADDALPAALRVVALRAPSPELPIPSVNQKSSVDETIRGALAASVTRLVRHDGPVRMGTDPEAVHQARVATRRLRSDLRTFAPLLEQHWVASLRAALAELADDLGSVRDADVLLGGLSHDAEGVVDRRAADRVLATLRASREADRARLIEVMDSDAYVALLDRLVQAATDPHVSAPRSDRASAVLPRLVHRAWRRLRRRVDALPAEPSDDQLHQVRIDAKRARYAAEAVAPAVGPSAERFAQAMADLQTHLGDLHDAVVATQWLSDHAGSDDAASAAIGPMIELRKQRAAALRATWSDVWDGSSRKSLRRWMR